jgi:hypothetical protein
MTTSTSEPCLRDSLAEQLIALLSATNSALTRGVLRLPDVLPTSADGLRPCSLTGGVVARPEADPPPRRGAVSTRCSRSWRASAGGVDEVFVSLTYRCGFGNAFERRAARIGCWCRLRSARPMKARRRSGPVSKHRQIAAADGLWMMTSFTMVGQVGRLWIRSTHDRRQPRRDGRQKHLDASPVLTTLALQLDNCLPRLVGCRACLEARGCSLPLAMFDTRLRCACL